MTQANKLSLKYIPNVNIHFTLLSINYFIFLICVSEQFFWIKLNFVKFLRRDHIILIFNYDNYINAPTEWNRTRIFFFCKCVEENVKTTIYHHKSDEKIYTSIHSITCIWLKYTSIKLLVHMSTFESLNSKIVI